MSKRKLFETPEEIMEEIDKHESKELKIETKQIAEGEFEVSIIGDIGRESQESEYLFPTDEEDNKSEALSNGSNEFIAQNVSKNESDFKNSETEETSQSSESEDENKLNEKGKKIKSLSPKLKRPKYSNSKRKDYKKSNSRDKETWNHFRKGKMNCKHCKTLVSAKVKRLRTHLTKCKKYLQGGSVLFDKTERHSSPKDEQGSSSQFQSCASKSTIFKKRKITEFIDQITAEEKKKLI